MRKLAKYLSVFTVTVFLLWLTGWAAFMAGISIARPDAVETPTDAIIVLTGGQNRINTGLDLLAAGKAKYLFISGVNPSVTIEQLARLWKPDFEYIPCCIVLGLAASNTEGNARESAEWVREQGIGSVRLVTSNYHMARAWLEFTHALPRHKILLHPIKPTSADYDNKHFLRLGFGEYNKTLLSWVRLYIYPWNDLVK